MIRRGDDGSAVDTGVISVRDQGGAVDFLTNTNAEDRDSFVSEKADNRGSYHCAQIRYLLGIRSMLSYPAIIALARIVSTIATPARSSTHP